MRNFLSPKEVALAIGVSESSLKRWADAGRVKVRRTAGGHRRIAIQEAIRFARENGFPVVRPDVLDLPEIGANKDKPSGGRHTLGELMYDKLVEGSAEEVRAMLLELYLAGRPLSDVFDGPMREAMERIGKEWRHGESGIYVEHRATDICIQAVTMVRGLISNDASNAEGEPARPIAIGGAPAFDPYTLPSLMIATVMADLGFREINLGPETPMKAMIAAARHYRPALVWLSCSVTDAAPPRGDLEGLAASVREWDGRVVLGGRGFEGRSPGSIDGIRYVPTISMLAHVAREILPQATQGPIDGTPGRVAGRGQINGAHAMDFEIIE